MRLKRIAVTAVVLIALVFAAVVIAVRYLDPRALALGVAASVKQDTGRDLTFGEVGVKLFPPAIVLSDVRLSNMPSGTQPWMARMARVELDIGVLALLRGKLRMTRIAVSDASLLLETDPARNGNWVMTSSIGGRPDWLSRLEIDALEFEPLAVTWRDGASGETVRLLLTAATLHAPTAAQPVLFDAYGNVAGVKLDISGSIGGLAALAADGDAYPVDIGAKLGTATLTLRGAVNHPLELGSLNFDLGAQGPEISDVAAVIGEKLPPLGAFHGTARVTGTPAAPALSNVDVAIGAPDRLAFTARGALEVTATRSGSLAWSNADLDLSVQGAQISELAELFGKSAPALGRYRIGARLTGSSAAPSLSNIDLAIGSDERVEVTVRGTVANLRETSGIDLQVTASAPHWWSAGDKSGGLRLPPFGLRTHLRDAPGGYKADSLELKIADSRLDATLSVTTGGVRPRIAAKASSPSIDLHRLVAATAGVASSPVRPGEHWKLADVDLDLRVGKLILADGRLVQTAAGRLSLVDGQLRVTALKATLGGAQVQGDGVIADPAHMSGLDVTFSLQGNELADLFKFAGHPMPSVGPYKGSARALGSLQTLQLTAIDATAGKSGQRLQATGQIKDTLNWQGLDLNLTANIADSVAFGRLFKAELPRLPRVRASARMTGPSDGYVFHDLKFALPRTAVQGRLAIVSADPRPRVTATLSGPLVDLGELPAPPKTGPLLGTDFAADVRFDRVILVDKRVLGPVSGRLEINAGAGELRQFSIGVDGATATLDGKVAEPLRHAGLDLTVTAQVKRAAGLRAFTGIDLPNLPPFMASGRVTDVPSGYAVSDLKLVSGATEINGDLAVDRGASHMKVTAKLTSPLLDARELKQSWPVRTGATSAMADARIFSDAPLPLDLLKTIDANVDLHVDKLRLSDAEPLGPLTVRAVLAEGRLRADPVQIGIGGKQSLAITGTVDTSKGRAALWSFALTGSSIDVGEMLKRFGALGLATGGVSDFTLEGSGRGNSARAILGGLTGSARMKVGPAVVHRSTGNLGAGLLEGLMDIVNPFRKTDPDTQVKCFGMHVPIKDGIATSDRQLAIETAKFNLVVSGTLNLRTEAIDLGVVGLGLSTGSGTQLVRIHGTFADPQLEANVAGAATRGALSLGAAYMTFGGSWFIESLVNRATGDANPCATALRE